MLELGTLSFMRRSMRLLDDGHAQQASERKDLFLRSIA